MGLMIYSSYIGRFVGKGCSDVTGLGEIHVNSPACKNWLEFVVVSQIGL